MNPVWFFLNGVPVIPVIQTGVNLAGDGSASAPSYSFASAPNYGFLLGTTPDTSTITAVINGTARVGLSVNGVTIGNTSVVQWGSSGLATPDTVLSRLAADVMAPAAGDAFGLAAKAWIRTAPTIASGFGTSPSVVASNGTASFTINVGTGGTASSGVITMPAATTGWICHVENLTQTAANRANVRTVQTASTTTSITVQNQTISTGAAVAWTASDVLSIIATAY